MLITFQNDKIQGGIIRPIALNPNEYTINKGTKGYLYPITMHFKNGPFVISGNDLLPKSFFVEFCKYYKIPLNQIYIEQNIKSKKHKFYKLNAIIDTIKQCNDYIVIISFEANENYNSNHKFKCVLSDVKNYNKLVKLNKHILYVSLNISIKDDSKQSYYKTLQCCNDYFNQNVQNGGTTKMIVPYYQNLQTHFKNLMSYLCDIIDYDINNKYSHQFVFSHINIMNDTITHNTRLINNINEMFNSSSEFNNITDKDKLDKNNDYVKIYKELTINHNWDDLTDTKLCENPDGLAWFCLD